MQKNKIKINEKNSHLEIGGCDAIKLTEKYQTPVIVYDVEDIRNQIHAFQNAFKKCGVHYVISYASKAFASIAIFQIMAQENCHLDVVSGGELYTAIKADFPMRNISFHGNNKSYDELEMAVNNNVGTIIIDNFHEIDLLSSILEQKQKQVDVLLRVTPGISAHTHEYIQTGQEDSKFGFDIQSGQATAAFQRIIRNPRMQLKGIHAHIGSQIFDDAGFKAVVKVMVKLIQEWRDQFGFVASVLNVGGGFGISYTESDHPLSPQAFVQSIVTQVKKECTRINYPTPEIWIEPGRSIVGNAGYTLYSIGSRKDIGKFLPYVAVDGGMGDNIRPALYGSKYTAVLARDPFAAAKENVRLVGKYCESGDILIKNIALPLTKPSDVIAVLSTGAYGYSMASNYNRNPRPAVVFAENGKSHLVIKRETYKELIENDLSYLSVK